MEAVSPKKATNQFLPEMRLEFRFPVLKHLLNALNFQENSIYPRELLFLCNQSFSTMFSLTSQRFLVHPLLVCSPAIFFLFGPVTSSADKQPLPDIAWIQVLRQLRIVGKGLGKRNIYCLLKLHMLSTFILGNEFHNSTVVVWRSISFVCLIICFDHNHLALLDIILGALYEKMRKTFLCAVSL